MRFTEFPFMRFKFQEKLFGKFSGNIASLYHSNGILNVPRLWCDLKQNKSGLLNHSKQLNHMLNINHYVGGYLVNNRLGYGVFSDMNNKLNITKEILHIMDNNDELKKPLIISCLEENVDNQLKLIDMHISMLLDRYNCDSIRDLYDYYIYNNDIQNTTPFVGFSINPIGNTTNQKEISDGFRNILNRYPNIPFILNQIPDVTNSEIHPEYFKSLVDNYPNLIMLQDASVDDKITKSGLYMGGIFALKSSDNNIIQHMLPKQNGITSYNGIMSVNANDNAKKMHDLLDNFVNKNDLEKALEISKELNNTHKLPAKNDASNKLAVYVVASKDFKSDI